MRNWRKWEFIMDCGEKEFRLWWIIEEAVDKPVDRTRIPEEVVEIRSVKKEPCYDRKYVSIISLDHSLGERLKKARENGGEGVDRM